MKGYKIPKDYAEFKLCLPAIDPQEIVPEECRGDWVFKGPQFTEAQTKIFSLLYIGREAYGLGVDSIARIVENKGYRLSSGVWRKAFLEKYPLSDGSCAVIGFGGISSYRFLEGWFATRWTNGEGKEVRRLSPTGHYPILYSIGAGKPWLSSFRDPIEGADCVRWLVEKK